MMRKELDVLVNPFLHTLGFDLNCGLIYRVCQHRTLSGKAVIGLQIAGEVRIDREFLSSPWCTAEDRIIACGRSDRSLGDDLARSMNIQVDYGNVFALEGEEVREHWQDVETIERIEDELAALGIVLDNLRGDQFKRDGSRKTPKDYWQEEPYEKVRKKKKDRSTLRHREQIA